MRTDDARFCYELFKRYASEDAAKSEEFKEIGGSDMASYLEGRADAYELAARIIKRMMEY